MVEGLISIIVPVYNICNEYLQECVYSIINQTYTNFELLLIDDGSEENCKKNCEKYSMIDSRIQVFHQKNQGVSVARNTGLQIASGEFIVFLDADDYVEKDYLEFLLSLLNHYNVDVAICDYDLAYINYHIKSRQIKVSQPLILNTEQALQQVLLRKYFGCSSASRIYKRKIIANITFPINSKNGEDIKFTWEVFKNCQKIVYSSESKYHYRQRKSSAVHTLYNENRESILSITADIKNECFISQRKLYDDAVYRYAQAILEVVEHSSLNFKMKEYKFELRKNFLILIKRRNNVSGNFKIAVMISVISLKAYQIIKKWQNKYRYGKHINFLFK